MIIPGDVKPVACCGASSACVASGAYATRLYMHAADDNSKGAACNGLPLDPVHNYWSFPFEVGHYGLCPAFRACGEGEGGFTAVVGLSNCAIPNHFVMNLSKERVVHSVTSSWLEVVMTCWHPLHRSLCDDSSPRTKTHSVAKNIPF